MIKPSIKIGIPPRDYHRWLSLAGQVIESMTGNARFPNPSPSLSELMAARQALLDALDKWGGNGNRGSHMDFVKLQVAVNEVRNLLKKEAYYVANVLNTLQSTPEEQAASILSSGFAVKGGNTPVGLPGLVQNLRQLLRKNYMQKPKIRWEMPLGMRSPRNILVYEVYRSAVNDFASAQIIFTSTKTWYVDDNAPRGSLQYYFIVAVTAAGEGIPSQGLKVWIY